MNLVEEDKAHRGHGYCRLALMAILILALMTGTLCTQVMSPIPTPDIYWVKAGAIGDGTSEANPAGNMSYVLGLPPYTPPYPVGPMDVIKVKPGTYNAAAGEKFPILVGVDDLTIESTNGAEVTTIDGEGVDLPVVEITSHDVNFRGFKVMGGVSGITSAFGGSASKVSNCIVTRNEIGIAFYATSDSIVEDNMISNNHLWGIFINYESHDNIIDDNIISNNGHGIDSSGDSNLIFGNTITGNIAMPDSGIHLTGLADDNIIHFNNIMDNSGPGNYGISKEGGTPVSAEYNWWGDVSGPSGVGPGGGDAVSEYVNYSPWSGSPIVATYYEIVPLDGKQHIIDGTAETGVKVTATTTLPWSPDKVIIIIARYDGNPHPLKPFLDIPLDVFFDMWIRWPLAVEWPIHVEVTYSDEQVRSAGISEPSLGLYHYVYTDRFYRCGDTGIVDVDRNIVWANISGEEYGLIPRTPFAVGGKPKPVGGVILPVNKLELLAPWIGLCAIVGVLIATMMIKKRKA